MHPDAFHAGLGGLADVAAQALAAPHVSDDTSPPLFCVAQDWADFTDVYERIRPGYLYHVRFLPMGPSLGFGRRRLSQLCTLCVMPPSNHREQPTDAPATLFPAKQVMINSLLINNRPEWCRWRLAHTMLPGESEAQAAARWQHVAVSAGWGREVGCAPRVVRQALMGGASIQH